jgi:glutamate---cysteine ligase / carboxylate-amine ligase
MSKIVDGAKIILKEQVKAEMHQSVVEVGTNICQKRLKLVRKFPFSERKLWNWPQTKLIVGASGTHPFSKWQDQPITDDPRYHMIVNELQDAARST